MREFKREKIDQCMVIQMVKNVKWNVLSYIGELIMLLNFEINYKPLTRKLHL